MNNAENKQVTDDDTRYLYWGPFVYRNDSLLYLQHAEGRCRWVSDTGVFRYDYFIKDHIGNVRTVVTTDAQSLSTYYLATHEIASANLEGMIFDNIDDVRSPNPTYETENEEVAMLDGSDPELRIGTSLLLQVMAGDKVNLQAWSYHEGKDPNEDNFVNTGDMLEALVNTLAGGVGGYEGASEIKPETRTHIMDNIFGNPQSLSVYEGLKLSNTNPDHPRAYLNYLFFDEDFKLLTEESRVIQVSGTANSWEQLSTPDIPVSKTGHLLVFISNEQAMKVSFDNIAVTYTKGRLLEENHYYPHGLLVKGTTAAGVTENKQKYQGKVMQDELGMQLYDFHARQYDPQIGRFWGIDPLDQYPSGYTGMGNDPANLVDPSGMSARMYDGGGYPTVYNPAHPGFRWRQQQLMAKAMQKMLEIEAANTPRYRDPGGDLRDMVKRMEEEMMRGDKYAQWDLMVNQMIERGNQYFESTGSPNMVLKDGVPTLKEEAERQAKAEMEMDDAARDAEDAMKMGNKYIAYAQQAAENINSISANGGAANYLPQYDDPGDKNARSDKGMSASDKVNIVLGSLGISLDAQNSIIDITIKTDESIKSIGVIKGFKAFGTSVNLLQIANTGYDIKTKGYSDERAVDVGIGIFSLFHPAGWIIGAQYNLLKWMVPVPPPPNRIDYIKTNAGKNQL